MTYNMSTKQKTKNLYVAIEGLTEENALDLV